MVDLHNTSDLTWIIIRATLTILGPLGSQVSWPPHVGRDKVLGVTHVLNIDYDTD